MAFSRVIENATKAKNFHEGFLFYYAMSWNKLSFHFFWQNILANFLSKAIKKRLRYKIYIKILLIKIKIHFQISKRAFFDNVLATRVWKNSWVNLSLNQSNSALSRPTGHFPPKRPQLTTLQQLYALDNRFTSTFFLICFLFVYFFFYFYFYWIGPKTFLLQLLKKFIVLYSRFMMINSLL